MGPEERWDQERVGARKEAEPQGRWDQKRGVFPVYVSLPASPPHTHTHQLLPQKMGILTFS